MNTNQENDESNMTVINRLGKEESLDVNKIVSRIRILINREPKIENLNAFEVMGKVTEKLINKIPTCVIDDYIASLCASASISNPYYGKLSNRISIDNHQKNTRRSFVDKMKEAYLNKFDNNSYPLVSSKFMEYVEEHQEFIESIIDYKRDFLIDYFGLETFKYMYCLKILQNENNDDDKDRKKYIERVQDMFMRVSIEIHANMYQDIDEELKYIKETYDVLSNKFISLVVSSILQFFLCLHKEVRLLNTKLQLHLKIFVLIELFCFKCVSFWLFICFVVNKCLVY
jgi:hypothetical protein